MTYIIRTLSVKYPSVPRAPLRRLAPEEAARGRHHHVPFGAARPLGQRASPRRGGRRSNFDQTGLPRQAIDLHPDMRSFRRRVSESQRPVEGVARLFVPARRDVCACGSVEVLRRRSRFGCARREFSPRKMQAPLIAPASLPTSCSRNGGCRRERASRMKRLSAWKARCQSRAASSSDPQRGQEVLDSVALYRA